MPAQYTQCQNVGPHLKILLTGIVTLLFFWPSITLTNFIPMTGRKNSPSEYMLGLYQCEVLPTGSYWRISLLHNEISDSFLHSSFILKSHFVMFGLQLNVLCRVTNMPCWPDLIVRIFQLSNIAQGQTAVFWQWRLKAKMCFQMYVIFYLLYGFLFPSQSAPCLLLHHSTNVDYGLSVTVNTFSWWMKIRLRSLIMQFAQNSFSLICKLFCLHGHSVYTLMSYIN